FRAEILLITFAVIFSTLVLQGLSLKPVIRALHLKVDRTLEHEEFYAREQAAKAALVRLEALRNESSPVLEHIDRLRVHYGQLARQYANGEVGEPASAPEVAEAFRRLRQETLSAERVAIIGLRDTGVISDEVLHRLEHELDVEELRLQTG